MSDKNKRYEAKKIASGLKKVTLWIPEDTAVEFSLMAEFCVENREYFPFMVRSHKTGKMKKGV